MHLFEHFRNTSSSSLVNSKVDDVSKKTLKPEVESEVYKESVEQEENDFEKLSFFRENHITKIIEQEKEEEKKSVEKTKIKIIFTNDNNKIYKVNIKKSPLDICLADLKKYMPICGDFRYFRDFRRQEIVNFLKPFLHLKKKTRNLGEKQPICPTHCTCKDVYQKNFT